MLRSTITAGPGFEPGTSGMKVQGLIRSATTAPLHLAYLTMFIPHPQSEDQGRGREDSDVKQKHHTKYNKLIIDVLSSHLHFVRLIIVMSCDGNELSERNRVHFHSIFTPWVVTSVIFSFGVNIE